MGQDGGEAQGIGADVGADDRGDVDERGMGMGVEMFLHEGAGFGFGVGVEHGEAVEGALSCQEVTQMGNGFGAGADALQGDDLPVADFDE